MTKKTLLSQFGSPCNVSIQVAIVTPPSKHEYQLRSNARAKPDVNK